MNYLNISHVNMVNGDGLRTVIWVSGCERKCPGCFSPHTHSFTAGVPFDQQAEDELFKDSKEDWCAGVTFCGGEPLHPANIDEVARLMKKHKELFPSKTIWVYTGYTWAEIVEDSKMSEILKYADVVCDGPFVESLKDVNLRWVGSSNQCVINVKERLKKIAGIANA